MGGASIALTAPRGASVSEIIGATLSELEGQWRYRPELRGYVVCPREGVLEITIWVHT